MPNDLFLKTRYSYWRFDSKGIGRDSVKAPFGSDNRDNRAERCFGEEWHLLATSAHSYLIKFSQKLKITH